MWQRILAIFPGVLQPSGYRGSWVERRISSFFPMYCDLGSNPNPKMFLVLFKRKEQLLSVWVWHVLSHWLTGSAESWIITRVQKDREPAAGFKVCETVA